MTSIPESHKDLLVNPVVVSLVTIMPDGQPQATPVWADLDNDKIVVNTARGRQKDRNMSERGRVTVLAVDPANPYRWLEVRGEIDEVDEASGLEWINRLARKYRGADEYYSGPMAAMKGKEQRVTYRIKPIHVNVGG
jgi:PPOX class probable F420-dependent enzyme